MRLANFPRSTRKESKAWNSTKSSPATLRSNSKRNPAYTAPAIQSALRNPADANCAVGTNRAQAQQLNVDFDESLQAISQIRSAVTTAESAHHSACLRPAGLAMRRRPPRRHFP